MSVIFQFLTIDERCNEWCTLHASLELLTYPLFFKRLSIIKKSVSVLFA